MKNEKLKKTFFSKTMMETRKAYLLTGEEDTPRKKFSVELLKKIGFEVVVVHYMDMILEEFTLINPALVCRYDLESKRKGHRGIFFQDRCQFPSTISNSGSFRF